ncbi:MAG: heme lyase CcmF/NrfE family subunit [Anaerolineae bacterium]|nr:heme lyase CcmF/NrfE family subunit [Anaerolineae bacterium]MBN8618011.1 heme lyase CcmF/NrfE family subunit [Anaerolineae bacterium]
MLAEIGLVTTGLAFLAALYAIVAGVISGRNHSESLLLSARNAALLTFPLLLVACMALWVALARGDYQISYVWSVSSPSTPLFYRITALWGSQKGSLLFWSFLMSLFAFGALILNWNSHRRLMPYAIAYMMAVLAFFIGLVIFYENPFARWWLTSPTDAVEAVLIPAGGVAPGAQQLANTARGLNPLLRHFGMIIHPPMLYLGFVGMVIPFAFAMAALGSGDLTTNWIKATRRWTLISWLFLSLGLILGGRWAYDVLGWGGYWGWDPVENAAFLPWLIGTAFLHSVMIQEKRGMLKVWNMFLVIGTFSAVIFGTFATRSGLIDSVHSFARSEIGMPMFLFWTAVTLISVGLILWRWNRGELKDEHTFANILSRESLFVLNNVIFVLLFITIFWGSFGAPVISDLFLNENITLGKEYFLQVTPPLFVALYVLMGVAPLSAWGATSLRRLGSALLMPLVLTAVTLVIIALVEHTTDPGALFGYGIVALAGYVALYETYRGAAARHRSFGETWLQALLALYSRNRRRYGGYLVHFGITVIGIGVIGSTLFQQETQRTLGVGESLDFGGYTMRYDGFTEALAEDGRQMQIADVTVIRGGQVLDELRPRHDIYPSPDGVNAGQNMTIAGSYSTLEADFYVLLVGWERATASSATFKVYINPLVNLVWWGGLVLILGTLVAAWPTEQIVPSRQTVSHGARPLGAKA